MGDLYLQILMFLDLLERKPIEANALTAQVASARAEADTKIAQAEASMAEAAAAIEVEGLFVLIPKYRTYGRYS